jgi:hypothetical protein
MMENVICQHTLPWCGGGGGLPTCIAIYSFHSSIRSIKRSVFYEPQCGGGGRGGGGRGRRRSGGGEEAGVEATMEEASGVESSVVESTEDLESFGMKSEMTRGMLLFIDSKISASIL